MITYKLKTAAPALMVALMGHFAVNAGTYKHITVDGNLSDWAGVPVAYTQAPDTTQSVAYTNIYVANDENYLYIRFAISTSDDPFTSHQNIFIDVDNNALTGYSAGGYVGSEMLVQGGAGYQEKAGVFNAGGINGLDWLAGTGLLGYTPNPGAYPTINTPLASGANTYYFRAHFNWNNLPDNVAF